MLTIEKFKDLVIRSGNRETSSTPERWEEENPTLGHCAIVALLVQELFGGDLLRASLEGTEFDYARSHYWNLLEDGTEIDLTEDQFLGRRPNLIGEVRSREYVLSNEQTRSRYEQFKQSVFSAISAGDK